MVEGGNLNHGIMRPRPRDGAVHVSHGFPPLQVGSTPKATILT